MNESRHTGDHGHHDNRQRVDTDCPIGLEFANADPGHQRNDVLLEVDAGRRGNKAGMVLFSARMPAKAGNIHKELDQ